MRKINRKKRKDEGEKIGKRTNIRRKNEEQKGH